MQLAQLPQVGGGAMNTSETILDRQPPCELEAERSVIGSILLLPDAIDDVSGIVDGSDFYDPANGALYEAIASRHRDGKKVDPTLLASELRKAGKLDAIGGTAYLAECFTGVATARNAKHYADLVRQSSDRRRFLSASQDMLAGGFDTSQSTDELVAAAEKSIVGIRDRTIRSEAKPMFAVMTALQDELEETETPPGVPTGLVDLDSVIGGVVPGHMLVLAARPSMGKTSLAINIADNVASTGRGVLVASMEMSASEVGLRLACARGQVDMRKVNQRTINTSEQHKLSTAMSATSQLPIWIDDEATRSPTAIASQLRRISRNNDIDLVIIDYLQLMRGDGKFDSRQVEVADLSRRLKALAREHNVAVLCLSQLNRQVEQRANKRPTLADLRESGAIELDADIVMFVHRPSFYETNEERRREAENEATLIVAKNRHGPTADVELSWYGKFTQFRDKATDDF